MLISNDRFGDSDFVHVTISVMKVVCRLKYDKLSYFFCTFLITLFFFTYFYGLGISFTYIKGIKGRFLMTKYKLLSMLVCYFFCVCSTWVQNAV